MSNNFFQNYATAYELVLPKLSFYREMLEKAAFYLKDCQSILDAGSGPCIYAKNHKKSGQTIISIDYEASMILGCQDLAFIGDVANLPFAPHRFDGLCSLNVLPFMPDYTQYLNELRRVVKPSGFVIISGIKKDHDMSMVAAQAQEDLAAYIDHPDYQAPIETVMKCNQEDLMYNLKNLFSLDEAAALLKAHGFAVVESSHIYLGQSYFIAVQKV